jgi:hypothetical protein
VHKVPLRSRLRLTLSKAKAATTSLKRNQRARYFPWLWPELDPSDDAKILTFPAEKNSAKV